MRRWLSCVLLLITLLSGSVFAQPIPEDDSILYITQYHLSSDQVPVFGVFDLGSKPSVRVLYPSAKAGKIQFKLHGRHYVDPIAKSFGVALAFEDTTGSVFQQSPRYTFNASGQKVAPKWFSDLDGIAGLFGDQTIEAQVPAGTTVIDILGEDASPSESPNMLMGYVSHIHLLPSP